MRKKGILLAVICIAATVANLTTYAKETPGTPTSCGLFKASNRIRFIGESIRSQVTLTVKKSPLVAVPSVTILCIGGQTVLCSSFNPESDFDFCRASGGLSLSPVSPTISAEQICANIAGGGGNTATVSGWYDNCL